MNLSVKLILLLAGVWLFGVGLRMCTQFILDPLAIYYPPTPNGSTWLTWDYWFDWFPMIPLGLSILYLAFKKDKKSLNIDT
jgi:hypothetical protein